MYQELILDVSRVDCGCIKGAKTVELASVKMLEA